MELYFNDLDHDAVKLTGEFDVIPFPDPISQIQLLRVKKLFKVSMPYKLVSEDMVHQDIAGFLNLILNNYDIKRITLIDDSGYVLIGNELVNIYDTFYNENDFANVKSFSDLVKADKIRSIYSEELDGIVFDSKLENKVL